MSRTRKSNRPKKQRRQSQRIAESMEKPNPSDQAGKLRLWSLRNAMSSAGKKGVSGKRQEKRVTPRSVRKNRRGGA